MIVMIPEQIYSLLFSDDNEIMLHYNNERRTFILDALVINPDVLKEPVCWPYTHQTKFMREACERNAAAYKYAAKTIRFKLVAPSGYEQFAEEEPQTPNSYNDIESNEEYDPDWVDDPGFKMAWDEGYYDSCEFCGDDDFGVNE